MSRAIRCGLWGGPQGFRHRNIKLGQPLRVQGPDGLIFSLPGFTGFDGFDGFTGFDGSNEGVAHPTTPGMGAPFQRGAWQQGWQ